MINLPHGKIQWFIVVKKQEMRIKLQFWNYNMVNLPHGKSTKVYCGTTVNDGVWGVVACPLPLKSLNILRCVIKLCK